MVAPAESYPMLTPALRKAASGNVQLELSSNRAVELQFAPVVETASPIGWPGDPILFAVDDRGAIIAARANDGDTVTGHWGTDAVFVATANTLLRQSRG